MDNALRRDHKVLIALLLLVDHHQIIRPELALFNMGGYTVDHLMGRRKVTFNLPNLESAVLSYYVRKALGLNDSGTSLA